MTQEDRLKKAIELLESQPEFASVQVQIHDRTGLIASRVSSRAKKLATPSRLKYIIDIFDAHAEAYQRLIVDIETQKAVMLFLEELARRSWEQYTGQPSSPIPQANIPGNRQLQRLQTRLRYWREESWKHLDSLRLQPQLRREVAVQTDLPGTEELSDIPAGKASRPAEPGPLNSPVSNEAVSAAAGTNAETTRPGPQPDRKMALMVKDIVAKIARGKRLRANLDKICEKLDEAKIPCPKTWAKREPPLLEWADAAATEPDLAKKAIEHRLKIAQNQFFPNSGLAPLSPGC